MSTACEWCGTAIEYLNGEWWRAKGGVGATSCEESEDGRHDPGNSRASHDTGRHCHCVYEHRPPVLELNRHHILPGYLAGDDAPGNIAWVCPTTHTNTHEVFRMLMRHGLLTYRQVQAAQDRPVSRYAYDLAAEGYRRWLATQPAPTS